MSEATRTILAVGLGSGAGGALRWLTTVAAIALVGPGFPLGTLTANLVGSFVLGGLAGLFVTTRAKRLSPTVRAGLGTGFCGGLTTFSFFGWQMVTLFETGLIALALVYLTLSITMPLGAVALGFHLGQRAGNANA